MRKIRYIDEEKKVRKFGFRNFRSFAAICYYKDKKTLVECGKIIGVSSGKMRSSLIERGFSPRRKGLLPGIAPIKKRRVDVWQKIRENTIFDSPQQALSIYYEKYLLTTKEIGDILKISPPFVCKLLRKYKIPVRNQGRTRFKRRSL